MEDETVNPVEQEGRWFAVAGDVDDFIFYETLAKSSSER